MMPPAKSKFLSDTPVEKLRKGLVVEVNGTAAQPAEVKVDADTACTFLNIQLHKDSAELTSAIRFTQLAEIAKGMTAAGTEHFLIEGHTRDLGGDQHNLTLPQNRALAVQAALTRLGVPAARLQGATEPVVANTDEAARPQNRRVQIFRKR
jgi:outer membrane protein OmpA-like peptidoglycan-associated protein